jgi:hypothetical protein
MSLFAYYFFYSSFCFFVKGILFTIPDILFYIYEELIYDYPPFGEELSLNWLLFLGKLSNF